MIDTFQLRTFSYKNDSIISDNTPFSILGSYIDPEFGSYNSEIYTQFRLSGISPDFGDLNTIIVDSFVLGLEYIGHYGETGVQTIEVFELGDDMHLDSTYYSFSTITELNSTNLVVPGTENIDLDPNNITVIGSDTVDSQLRIQLDTLVAKSLLTEAMSGNGTFDDNDSFISFFKGLHIKTNNPSQMPGEGGVFYFNLNDPASKLTIYYTQDGEQKTFDFLINSSCADFNHVDIDNSGTFVESVLNDTVPGQVQYYAQSYGSRAVVEIPGLDNIPSTAIIHKAVLDLPVAYETGSVYSTGLKISVATLIDNKLFSINTAGDYSEYTKSFEIDLRTYIQAIVNNEVENTGIILSPLLHNTSADRIIFNGPSTTNKAKPKLSILYTEF